MEKIYSCPICKDFKISGKHGPKLFINEEKGLYFCFHCEAGGKLKDIESRLSSPVSIKRSASSSNSFVVRHDLLPYYYLENVRNYVEDRIPRKGAVLLDLYTDMAENVVFVLDGFMQKRSINDKHYVSYGKVPKEIIKRSFKGNSLVIVEGFFDAGYLILDHNILITF